MDELPVLQVMVSPFVLFLLSNGFDESKASCGYDNGLLAKVTPHDNSDR